MATTDLKKDMTVTSGADKIASVSNPAAASAQQGVQVAHDAFAQRSATAPAQTPAATTPAQTPAAKPSYNGVEYDLSTDYQAQINAAVAKGDYKTAAQLEAARNAKILGEGLNYQTTNKYGKYADGTTAAPQYGYDPKVDYQAEINAAVAKGDYKTAALLEQQRNAKIISEGLSTATTNKWAAYLAPTAEQAGLMDPNSTKTEMLNLLQQIKDTALQQANGKIDFATQQAIIELERTLEDAKPEFQTQLNQIAADERKAMDNSALYAEARGDRGGIGQEQYNQIQSSAAQNRLAVSQAQTKLSTDTARQIADLRAKGEFEKADAILEVTQNYLSQLMSMYQWAASYAMDYAQFQESLRQWQVELDMNIAQLTGKLPDGQKTYAAQQAEKEQQIESAKLLISMGILPSDSQIAALGWTKAQAQAAVAQVQKDLTSSGRGAGSSSSSKKTADKEDGKSDTKKVSTGYEDGQRNPQFNGNGSSPTSVTSLGFYPDEGVFTWNGASYYSTYELAKAIDAAKLTPAQIAVLENKYRSQTGQSISFK